LYISHGISKSAYHVYKFAAKSGSISGSHRNFGILRLSPHMIQAKAIMMTIINKTVDKVFNETRKIDKK
jgi:hypothetical protein